MNNEFICRAAVATVNYINDVNQILAKEGSDGYFDLSYTVNIEGREYKHGAKLKVIGNEVIGGFYDAIGGITPMEQQKIEFQIEGNTLNIISIFLDAREERQFAEWATYSNA